MKPDVPGSPWLRRRSPRNKLSPADVLKIRELRAAGIPVDIISTKFNVHPQTIYKILAREIWASLKEPQNDQST